MKRDFREKVVLVTGSTSGIGEEIVKRMAQLGAKVVVTGRSAQNVSRVAADCYKLSPSKIKPLEVVADVTVEADSKRLIEETINRFGRLDVLVNNAGFCQLTSVFNVESLENYDQVMKLDVRASVHLTLLAVPHLIKTKGNIVNISSICAIKPLQGFYAYCMAKAAIDSFTKCSALELGPKGVRINAINAGGVKSKFLNAIGFNSEQVKQQEEFLKKSSPLNLLGEPEDIADLVLYMASDEAKFMTGSCVTIDGGTLNSTLSVVN